MIIMTRRIGFSAAHYGTVRSSNSPVSEAVPSLETDTIYGHNYLLDVSVRGQIDSETGIVINIKEIDRIALECIVSQLHGKLIDLQVPYFQRLPVTPENLLEYCLVELRDALPASVELYRLRLIQTPTCSAEWVSEAAFPRPGTYRNPGSRDLESENWPCENDALGNGGYATKGTMLFTRGYEFSASHRLHSQCLSAEANQQLFGKCNNPNGHGHNYEVEITVVGPICLQTGQLIAPEKLDAIVQREVIDRYDHRHLNFDVVEFAQQVPSAENITCEIWHRIAPHIPAPVRLYRVLLRETPRNIFEYYGEV